MKYDILVVDDDAMTLDLVVRSLRPLALNISTARDGVEARTLLEKQCFDLLLTDLEMPRLDGIGLLARARQLAPDMPVVVVTGRAERLDDAVAAVRRGAYHYLVKPLHPEVLRLVTKQALEHGRLVREREHYVSLLSELAAASSYGALVGKSARMRKVFTLVEKVAARDSTVLLTGETGTGKELVAHEIHRRSPRAREPFVTINCAALPETMLEAELFGYQKGAFSGAVRAKPGRLELADGGTSFLDEVGTLTASLQAKLLRFLAVREFERLGSVRTQKVDVRVIAATNHDLARLVEEGRFRDDLFYRLNVFPIALPPLRARKDDIPLLAEQILTRLEPAERHHRLAPEALEVLVAYPWPGNVRELENVLERAVIVVADEVIRPEDVSVGTGTGGATPPATAVPPNISLADLEKQALLANLRVYKNRRRVAKALGISPSTLYLKLKEFGLEK